MSRLSPMLRPALSITYDSPACPVPAGHWHALTAVPLAAHTGKCPGLSAGGPSGEKRVAMDITVSALGDGRVQGPPRGAAGRLISVERETITFICIQD